MENAKQDDIALKIDTALYTIEKKNPALNQQWAQRKRLLDGTSSLYSRKCYGYEKQKDGALTVLPEQASIVQHIFELYLSESSILGIQKQLKKKKYPPLPEKLRGVKRALRIF